MKIQHFKLSQKGAVRLLIPLGILLVMPVFHPVLFERVDAYTDQFFQERGSKALRQFFQGEQRQFVDKLLKGSFAVPRRDVFLDIKPESMQNYFYPKGSLETVVETAAPEAPPQYNISFVYIGVKESYVSYNGSILRVGDLIGEQEWIRAIHRDKIELQGKWGKRWVSVK